MEKNEIDDLAQEGLSLMRHGNHNAALILFNQVLQEYPENSLGAYGRAACLSVILRDKPQDEQEDLKDEILRTSRRLIAVTPEERLQPYSKEHLFPRETLRFAYRSLAAYGMERATSRRDIEKALENIDHCLSLRSPLDKEESLFGCLETKVRILLKLERTEEAYFIAHIVLKKDPRFEDLQDIKESKEYKAWLEEGGAEGAPAKTP
jgi:tetratricopeptide (TPR) repeat protein